MAGEPKIGQRQHFSNRGLINRILTSKMAGAGLWVKEKSGNISQVSVSISFKSQLIVFLSVMLAF